MSDSDSDEWGDVGDDLDIDAKLAESMAAKANVTDDNDGKHKSADDEDFWKVEPKETEPPTKPETTKKETKSGGEGEPMIIVDITQLDSNIHSKFDRNSVNDVEGASKLRKSIESNYQKYKTDSNLIANGTIIPCGSSGYRDALKRLRDERQGHYFVPIFPPKQK